jgi:hypothetical protein
MVESTVQQASRHGDPPKKTLDDCETLEDLDELEDDYMDSHLLE